MKMKLIFTLCAAVLASCMPSGDWFGKSTTSRTDTLILNNGTEPETLDPVLMSGAPEGRLATSLFEGLTRKDPKTVTPLPGVARSWKSYDGYRRFVFTLRTNAFWSNGRRVTAEDFVYSWRRLLDPKTGARYAEFLYCLENGELFNKGKLKDVSKLGVRAIDAGTLEVRLKQPTPYFPEIAAFYVTMPTPREAVEKYGSNWVRPGNLVCNGPFRLKQWRMHNRIVLEKNPKYWGASSVKLKQVVYLPIQDASSAINLYRAGTVDIVFEAPLELTPFLRKKKDWSSHPGWGTYGYNINTTKGVLKNKLVRQALCLAVDRQAIVDFLKGGQVAAYSFTPPYIKGYTPPKVFPFNPAEAKKRLAMAGYPGGNGFPGISILYNTSKSHQHIAEIIQKMWERHLGIKVELKNQEWKVFLDNTSNLRHEISRYGWIGDFFDPATFLDMFRSSAPGGNNNTGWSPPAYKVLLNKALSTGNLKQRYAWFRKAETMLLEDAAFLPLYIYSFNTMVKRYVKGFYPNVRDEHPLREVYISNKGDK